MNKILCDIGNTNAKLFTNNQLITLSIDEAIARFGQKEVFFISVNHRYATTFQGLKSWIDIEPWFDFHSSYQGIGIDRVATAIGVENGVIVDAGSAITVDVMKNGVHQGGFIALGLRSMRQSYANISQVLDREFNFDVNLDKIPQNTQEAISYFALKSLKVSIETLAPTLPLYLTGGDRLALQKILPEAIVDEVLLFRGLQKVLKDRYANGCLA